MKRWKKWTLGAVSAVLLGFAGWLVHIDYFSHRVYYEMPVAASASQGLAGPRTVAVLFSGDMGIRTGMGPEIAARLVGDGIPVLGVSSLAEFRRRHTPDEVRAFIAASIRRALAFAKADRVIVIGQSFGADMLQVGATGLPADLRGKVQMVALVVPGDSVIFRTSPAELFDLIGADAPALPTARQLTWAPTICLYGREEDDSLCPHLDLPNVQRVALPGGHPLHHDPVPLYAAIRRKIAETRPSANITKSSESGNIPASRDGA